MSSNNLNEILTCKVCNNFYNYPVLLPCGNNICREHTLEQIDYDCLKMCSKKHIKPEEGFPINNDLVKIISLNLHLDEKTRTANGIINQFDVVRKQKEILKKDPDNFIFDYISDIKNKIELRRENLKSKIDDVSDEMINKVNEINKEIKSKLIEINHSLESNEINQSDYWKSQLSNPNITEQLKDEILKESNKLLNTEKENLIDLESRVMNGKGCYFYSSDFIFTNDSFGELVIDDYKTVKSILLNGNNLKFNSSIIKSSQYTKLTELCEIGSNKKFKLLYRATRDGFSSLAFHQKCDNIPNTLSIIKVKDKPHIFGGFTEAAWDTNSSYKQDRNAFIFSLVNDYNKPIKLKILGTSYINGINCYATYGPTFGGGHDFCITSDSNINLNSYSNLGFNYQHESFKYGSNEAKNFLAGSFKFSTSEIEVFQII